MTWGAPLLAGVAAAIAVPTLIILYFLKLRRRDVEISTTLLWKKTIQDMQANAPFQRLRRNILLLLQLLVLAGLLMAIGQPEIKGDASSGQQHVILIDRSASMRATDGDTEDTDRSSNTTRLAKAKQAALKLVDSLREPGVLGAGTADEAMVIAFDTNAQVRQQFTSDKSLLKAAIEAIEPSDAPSALTEAMRLARAHLPNQTQVDPSTGKTIVMEGIKKKGVTMHLYSDGRLPDAIDALTGKDDIVDFVQVGSPDAANVAISAMRAERSFDTPTQLSLYVGLENTDHTPRQVDLELLIDGVTSQIKTITIPPATPPSARSRPSQSGDDDQGDLHNAEETTDKKSEQADEAAQVNAVLPWSPGRTGVAFEFEHPEGGIFAAQITPSDGGENLLTVDDRAQMIVPPARKLAVALVTRGNLFLVTALEGLPLAQLKEYTPDQYEAARAAGQMSAFDLVIFDRWVPAIDGRPGLPEGRFLVLGAIPSPLGIESDTEPGPAVMLDWKRDHPVMRLTLLDNLMIAKLPHLVVPDDAGLDVLATADKGPGILELTTAKTHAIIVPFDVAESTWPFDVSFVIFTGASVQYLGQDAGIYGDRGDSLKPGSVLTDRLPLGAADVTISVPDAQGNPGGTTIAISPAVDGRIAFGPIDHAGLYRLSWTGPVATGDMIDGGKATRLYAANLLDAQESDIAASPMLRLAALDVTASKADTTKATYRLWPWLILAGLLILMLEWYVYNRKVSL